MRGALVRCPRCGSFVQVPGARNAQSSQDNNEGEHAPQFKVTDVPDLGPPTIIFSCKHCRSRIETEAANAGLPCICPGCHVDLIIPGTARPILLPQPSNPPAPRPPLLDRVMLAILLGTVGLGAILLLSTLAGK
jgi:hypothetical protein